MDINTTENQFKKWLDEKKYSYFFIEQTNATFAEIFKSNAKRPDFIVKLPSECLIAVDVKERVLNEKYETFRLDEKKEILKLSSFELKFPIPVWFAFTRKDEAYEKWYLISLKRIIQEAQLYNFKGNQVRAIKKDSCVILGWEDDLEKISVLKDIQDTTDDSKKLLDEIIDILKKREKEKEEKIKELKLEKERIEQESEEKILLLEKEKQQIKRGTSTKDKKITELIKIQEEKELLIKNLEQKEKELKDAINTKYTLKFSEKLKEFQRILGTNLQTMGQLVTENLQVISQKVGENVQKMKSGFKKLTQIKISEKDSDEETQ